MIVTFLETAKEPIQEQLFQGYVLKKNRTRFDGGIEGSGERAGRVESAVGPVNNIPKL